MNIFNIKFRECKRELEPGLIVRNSLYNHYNGVLTSIHNHTVWAKEDEYHSFSLLLTELEILDGLDSEGKEVWIPYHEYV